MPRWPCQEAGCLHRSWAPKTGLGARAHRCLGDTRLGLGLGTEAGSLLPVAGSQACHFQLVRGPVPPPGKAVRTTQSMFLKFFAAYPAVLSPDESGGFACCCELHCNFPDSLPKRPGETQQRPPACREAAITGVRGLRAAAPTSKAGGAGAGRAVISQAAGAPEPRVRTHRRRREQRRPVFDVNHPEPVREQGVHLRPARRTPCNAHPLWSGGASRAPA